jgi:hypothetical protein
MELLEIPLWIGGSLLFDWLVAGQAAGLSPSVDYRWWPISMLRLITLAFLSAAVALDSYYGFKADWTLLLSIFAAVVYFGAILADLQRQRERGPLPSAPSRYSETDGDY